MTEPNLLTLCAFSTFSVQLDSATTQIKNPPATTQITTTMTQTMSNDDDDILVIATFAMVDATIQTIAPLQIDSTQV